MHQDSLDSPPGRATFSWGKMKINPENHEIECKSMTDEKKQKPMKTDLNSRKTTGLGK